jgi:hypothetical protein
MELVMLIGPVSVSGAIKVSDDSKRNISVLQVPIDGGDHHCELKEDWQVELH